MPSLVAELGMIVEDHLKSIGMLHDPEMSEHQRALIAEKRKQFEERSKKNAESGPSGLSSADEHPEDIEVTGDGAHFEALIVCPVFEGKRTLARHQADYQALGERMRAEIHALSMRNLTPAEYAATQDDNG